MAAIGHTQSLPDPKRKLLTLPLIFPFEPPESDKGVLLTWPLTPIVCARCSRRGPRTFRLVIDAYGPEQSARTPSSLDNLPIVLLPPGPSSVTQNREPAVCHHRFLTSELPLHALGELLFWTCKLIALSWANQTIHRCVEKTCSALSKLAHCQFKR